MKEKKQTDRKENFTNYVDLFKWIHITTALKSRALNGSFLQSRAFPLEDRKPRSNSGHLV